jgi:hypothetical protein
MLSIEKNIWRKALLLIPVKEPAGFMLALKNPINEGPNNASSLVAAES